jgi:hypothetical protein
MDILDSNGLSLLLISIFIKCILVIVILRLLFKFVLWTKKMPKGAFIFLAIMPLISLFPIPPHVFKNVEKAKQEQRKKKGENGDPPYFI